MNALSISRGWAVLTSDGKRVGDVTEVHPTYVLVSQGVLIVRDMYLPLGTIDRVENKTVILTVTHEMLRRMDLKHKPPDYLEPATEPVHDPEQVDYPAPEYGADAMATGDAIDATSEWPTTPIVPYDEMPTYVKPQPNGLVEVDHTVNCAFDDLGYGQTILLLQGWPFDCTVWEPLPTMLAVDRRVVTFDPRGLGRSDRPWDFYTVQVLANDLHRLIVEQSLRDITLVAWSTAALVALQYAGYHQDRLERLVLLNPLVPVWSTDNGGDDTHRHGMAGTRTLEAWAEALANDRANFMEHFVDRLTHRPLSGPQRHWLWQRLMYGAHHAQVKIWDALRAEDPTDWLQQLSLPVTILTGEHDHLSSPDQALRLTELLPRAQYLTLADCGHAAFIDVREVVAQTLRDLTTIPEYSPANDVDGEITESTEFQVSDEESQTAGEVTAETFGYGDAESQIER